MKRLEGTYDLEQATRRVLTAIAVRRGYIALDGEFRVPIYGGADWQPGPNDRSLIPALRHVARVRGYLRDNGAVLACFDTKVGE